jgi:hypothetical protein
MNLEIRALFCVIGNNEEKRLALLATTQNIFLRCGNNAEKSSALSATTLNNYYNAD